MWWWTCLCCSQNFTTFETPQLVLINYNREFGNLISGHLDGLDGKLDLWPPEGRNLAVPRQKPHVKIFPDMIALARAH